MGRPEVHRLIVATALSLLVGFGGATSAGAQTDGDESDPTLTTVDARYDRGQEMRVTGENWPGNTIVTVELCGNDARNGTVDCDARTSRTVATTRDGELFVDLLATAPPSACPCIVHAFVPEGTIDLGVRVEITGVPVEEVTELAGPDRSLEVTDAELTGGHGLAEYFGGAPRRSLQLEITNTGDVPVARAAVRAGWGREGDATRPVDVDDLDALAPGESVTVEVPVEMSPLSVGSYSVEGSLVGFAGATFAVGTTSYPLGLLAVVFLAVLLIGFVLYRRVDRRAEAEVATAPDPK